MGYTVGRWEGDTLVLDSISFVDTTWFGRGGLFHSANMHIVEKFTRKGDEILYEITIEDPEVLVEPWVMPPRTLRLNRAADAGLVAERAYCEVYEDGRHHESASTLGTDGAFASDRRACWRLVTSGEV